MQTVAKTLKDFVDAALREVLEVDPSELAGLAEEGWIVLDVREPDEFAAGHVPSSWNFPRGFLEVRADLEHPKRDERLADRSQRFACICGGGHRSALAAQTLQQMGFTTVRSVRGGWSLYCEQGLPVEVS